MAPIRGPFGRVARSIRVAALAITAGLLLIPGLAMPTTAQSEAPIRQRSDEAPQFVGPATLELEGGRGTFVWDEVRFGAHEIALLLAARDSGRACHVDVRLPAGGVPEDADDDTAIAVAVEPGTEVVDATRLVVDYATSRLRIDSDCEAWSLRLIPLTDPELAYTVARRTYPVRGESLEKLAPQTRQVRGRFAAYTRWDTDWTFGLREHADGCDVVGGDIRLTARVVLPLWRRPQEPAAGVTRRWQRFLDNLETHELGHITIALQGADAIDDLLDAGLSAGTCEQVTRRANRAARELHDRWERVNARYDERTDHGIEQGTGLP
jgi:predicted secreted Zn-dependent protease